MLCLACLGHYPTGPCAEQKLALREISSAADIERSGSGCRHRDAGQYIVASHRWTTVPSRRCIRLWRCCSRVRWVRVQTGPCEGTGRLGGGGCGTWGHLNSLALAARSPASCTICCSACSAAATARAATTAESVCAERPEYRPAARKAGDAEELQACPTSNAGAALAPLTGCPVCRTGVLPGEGEVTPAVPPGGGVM